MTRLPPLRDLADAPEILEIVVADVALLALEAALQLVHGAALAADRPLPTRLAALRLLHASRSLRRALGAYRATSLRLLRKPPPRRDRLF